MSLTNHELLDLARLTGLRVLLHGVDATTAGAALSRFVAAVDYERMRQAADQVVPEARRDARGRISWIDPRREPGAEPPPTFLPRNPARHDHKCVHCGREEEEHWRSRTTPGPARCRREHLEIRAWEEREAAHDGMLRQELDAEAATTASPAEDYVDADRHTPTPRRRRADQEPQA